MKTNRSSRLVTGVTALFLAFLSLSGAASAKSAMSVQEFRMVLLDWAEIVDSARPGQSGSQIGSMIARLNDEELEILMDSVPDPGALADTLASLDAAPAAVETQTSGVTTSGLPAATFPPPYPSGPSYQVFTATLSGMGALSDSNGDGLLNDERCSADFEALHSILLATAKAADGTLNLVCDGNLEPISRAICFGGAAIAFAFLVAEETILSQCSLQDALVDSAEIEAAYENSLAIHANLDTHDEDIKQVLLTVKAAQRQILRLLLTPQGRRKVDPDVLTCTGDDCPQVLDCPGTECRFPIVPGRGRAALRP